MCISCSLRFCHCYFIQFSLRLFILYKIEEFRKGFSLLCASVNVCVPVSVSEMRNIRIWVEFESQKKIHINKVCHFCYRICLFLRFDVFFLFFSIDPLTIARFCKFISICSTFPNKIVYIFFRIKKKIRIER